MAYKDPLDERYRAARRKHYRENKTQYLERNKSAKAERRAWLNDYKDRPCADCGQEYPPYVMDFDHRDPSKKVASVGRLITHSWKKLLEEVDKCDVVCANCHRIRTYGHDVTEA